MPAMIPTDHYGTITWLGRMPTLVGADLIIRAEPIAEMPLSFAGHEGEVHAGLTRPFCSRVLGQYPRGTTIANTRQLSIVSAEEMAKVARELGLDAMDYTWVGASVVVEGIPDLSHLPSSSRLQAESGATLVVDLSNAPCLQVAKTIETARPGHGKSLKAAAKGRRGITAWVEREGTLHLGERVHPHIPGQRAWMPDTAAPRAAPQRDREGALEPAE